MENDKSTTDPDGSLYCKICDKHFTKSCGMVIHMQRLHKINKTTENEPIGKKRRESTEKRNGEIVVKERKIECNICGNRFKSNAMLIVHKRSHTGEKPFNCKSCDMRFSSKHQLTTHVQRRHSETAKKFQCNICNKKFLFKSTLETHKKVHSDDAPFECEICPQKFKGKNGYLSHMTTHTGENNFPCKICGNVYASVYGLKTHMNNHTKEKLYKCHICTKVFLCNGSLTKHLSVHSENRPYKCKICGKGFKQNSAMHTHQNTHKPSHLKKRKYPLGMKMFPCEVCKKAFSSKGHLKDHMRLHNGDIYQCDICNKTFMLNKQFQIHKRLHTGEVTHTCEVCGRGFTCKEYYKKHHETVHLGVRRHQCTQCGARFTQWASFNRHQKVHSGETPFQCTECDKKYRDKHSLQLHMRIHTGEEKSFKCTICSKGFTRKFTLLLHYQSVHKKLRPFKCEICQQSFPTKGNLSKHLSCKHAGDRQYICKCEVCGKKFKVAKSLKTHMKIVHEGIRPYECSICQKDFSSAGNLRNHLISHVIYMKKEVFPYDSEEEEIRKSEFQYICKICGQVAKSVSGLGRHVANHTQVEKTRAKNKSSSEKECLCIVCHKEFKSEKDLKTHIVTHAFEMKKDKTHATDKSNVENNGGDSNAVITSVTERKKENNNVFDMTNDESYDKGRDSEDQEEAMYLCGVCHKGFSSDVDLKRHIVLHRNSSKDSSSYHGNKNVQINISSNVQNSKQSEKANIFDLMNLDHGISFGSNKVDSFIQTKCESNFVINKKGRKITDEDHKGETSKNHTNIFEDILKIDISETESSSELSEPYVKSNGDKIKQFSKQVSSFHENLKKHKKRRQSVMETSASEEDLNMVKGHDDTSKMKRTDNIFDEILIGSGKDLNVNAKDIEKSKSELKKSVNIFDEILLGSGKKQCLKVRDFEKTMFEVGLVQPSKTNPGTSASSNIFDSVMKLRLKQVKINLNRNDVEHFVGKKENSSISNGHKNIFEEMLKFNSELRSKNGIKNQPEIIILDDSDGSESPSKKKTDYVKEVNESKDRSNKIMNKEGKISANCDEVLESTRKDSERKYESSNLGESLFERFSKFSDNSSGPQIKVNSHKDNRNLTESSYDLSDKGSTSGLFEIFSKFSDNLSGPQKEVKSHSDNMVLTESINDLSDKGSTSGLFEKFSKFSDNLLGPQKEVKSHSDNMVLTESSNDLSDKGTKSGLFEQFSQFSENLSGKNTCMEQQSLKENVISCESGCTSMVLNDTCSKNLRCDKEEEPNEQSEINDDQSAPEFNHSEINDDQSETGFNHSEISDDKSEKELNHSEIGDKQIEFTDSHSHSQSLLENNLSKGTEKNKLADIQFKEADKLNNCDDLQANLRLNDSDNANLNEKHQMDSSDCTLNLTSNDDIDKKCKNSSKTHNCENEEKKHLDKEMNGKNCEKKIKSDEDLDNTRKIIEDTNLDNKNDKANKESCSKDCEMDTNLYEEDKTNPEKDSISLKANSSKESCSKDFEMDTNLYDEDKTDQSPEKHSISLAGEKFTVLDTYVEGDKTVHCSDIESDQEPSDSVIQKNSSVEKDNEWNSAHCSSPLICDVECIEENKHDDSVGEEDFVEEYGVFEGVSIDSHYEQTPGGKPDENELLGEIKEESSENYEIEQVREQFEEVGTDSVENKTKENEEVSQVVQPSYEEVNEVVESSHEDFQIVLNETDEMLEDRTSVLSNSNALQDQHKKKKRMFRSVNRDRIANLNKTDQINNNDRFNLKSSQGSQSICPEKQCIKAADNEKKQKTERKGIYLVGKKLVLGRFRERKEKACERTGTVDEPKQKQVQGYKSRFIRKEFEGSKETERASDGIIHKEISDESYSEMKEELSDNQVMRKTSITTSSELYHCDICEETFKTKSKLRSHKLKHRITQDDNYLFKCQACGKGFYWEDHLQRHMNIHLKSSTYVDLLKSYSSMG